MLGTPAISRAILIAACALLPLSLRAQSTPTPDAAIDWGDLKQLVGHWVVDSGGGHPGTTTRAEETFAFELGGHALIRHDFSEYASVNGAPGIRHDGLLIIFPTGAGAFAAHSYDNEGHLIDYAISTSNGVVTFTSPVSANAPQFRLTYAPTGSTMHVRFEIAPPGQAGAFQLYVAGTTHRISP